jgi:hypothetical protein
MLATSSLETRKLSAFLILPFFERSKTLIEERGATKERQS